MNTQLLIDEIMRQTTVLIAQLATSGGARTPLSDIAEQVFGELAKELQRQGVSRKVAADMFGMALRTYRRKVQRLGESQTVANRTLWEAVQEFVAGRPGVERAEVLRHFARDDEEIVRGVLQDLVETGLCYRAGKGARSTYRAVTRADVDERSSGAVAAEGLDMLVWAVVYRLGPIGRDRVGERVALPSRSLDASLARLTEDGRITVEASSGAPLYSSPSFVAPLGVTQGWEASVYDHFQAVVMTICRKLSRGASAEARDRLGGSTYTLEVWDGHPLESEVLAELGEFRRRLGNLRQRVMDHNRSTGVPARRSRVVIYGGQCVIEQENEPGEDSDP